MGSLALYVDLVSQPCRALVIFCKVNGIPFTQEVTPIGKGQHQTEKFKAMFPLAKLPAMDDAGFRLCESHAILRYLVATRPCGDHWYPSDVHWRARVDMLLDWHHSNLRKGAATLMFQEFLAPIRGVPRSEDIARDARAVLDKSVLTMETLWLDPGSPLGGPLAQGGRRTAAGPFFLGAARPSVADLSMACELSQLQLLGQDLFNSVLADAPRVKNWLRAVSGATAPHFQDAETVLRAVAARRNRKGKEPLSGPGPSRGAARGGGAPKDSFPEGREMNQLYSPSAAGTSSRDRARM